MRNYKGAKFRVQGGCNGPGSHMNFKDMEKKKKEVESLAKEVITYVEKHKEVYDWSQMPKKLSYRRVGCLAKNWACMLECRDYCNEVFQGRLVHLGIERSKMSDSFVKFLLSRRHGWVEKQEVDMKVEGSLSFRDLISGMNEEKDEEDGENTEETE